MRLACGSAASGLCELGDDIADPVEVLRSVAVLVNDQSVRIVAVPLVERILAVVVHVERERSVYHAVKIPEHEKTGVVKVERSRLRAFASYLGTLSARLRRRCFFL